MDEFLGPQPLAQPATPDQGMEKLNIKVLLADDTESVMRLTVRMLKSMGCTVDTVVNGRLLLDRLIASEPGEFGLVITDKEMPVMNGIEVVRNIRADNRFKKLPLILYSGSLSNEDQDIVNAFGGVCLSKPFENHELAVTIDEAILKVA